jgi:hypothetical protein
VEDKEDNRSELFNTMALTTSGPAITRQTHPATDCNRSPRATTTSNTTKADPMADPKADRKADPEPIPTLSSQPL